MKKPDRPKRPPRSQAHRKDRKAPPSRSTARQKLPTADRRLAALFYVCAFFSGFAALMYEITWAKMLSLSFGSTTLAASGVIAGFMGGMGLGAKAYGRFFGTSKNPVRIYAWLEFGIAVSTGVLTLFFYGLPDLLAGIAGQLPGGMVFECIRFLMVFVVLLIPAALMGATFPAFCSIMIGNVSSMDRRLGWIYGINTVGGAVGAMIGGVFIVEFLGLTGSVRVANVLNVLIGVAVLVWGRRRVGERAGEAPGLPTEPDLAAAQGAGGGSAADGRDVTISTVLPAGVVGTVLLVSGMSTLAYEILWFRALRYTVGNSTYALSTVLVVFLVGLGFGALLLAPTLRRMKSERALGLVQCAIGVLGLVAVACEWGLLSSETLRSAVSIHSTAVQEEPWWQRLAVGATAAAVTMLPATLLMGLSFPLASRLYIADVRRIGRRSGGAYWLANVGSVVGAVGAAAVLLPALGSVGGTKLLAGVNLLLGVWVLVAAKDFRPNARRVAFCGAAVLGLSIVLPRAMPLFGEQIDAAETEVVFFEEGDLATVQVLQNPKRPERRSMTIDGYQIGWSEGFRSASTYRKQVMLTHLPMVLEPRSRRTLNIGLGSCATLDALTKYDGLERIECVEINQAVVDASAYFPESRSLSDPRVELVVEDAVHLLLREDDPVDLVISDGKQHPYFAGNAALLCREFYTFVNRRLSPQGLFVQWTPLGMLASDFRINLRTMCRVFDHVEVFYFPPDSVFVVGSKMPLAGRPTLDADRFAASPAADDLTFYFIDSVESLLSRWVASGDQIEQVLGDGPVSVWDHMILDFSTYKSNPSDWIEARVENLDLLMRASAVACAEPVSFSPPQSAFVESSRLIRRAFFEQARGRIGAAAELAKQACAANPKDRGAKIVRDLFERQRQAMRRGRTG